VHNNKNNNSLHSARLLQVTSGNASVEAKARPLRRQGQNYDFYCSRAVFEVEDKNPWAQIFKHLCAIIAFVKHFYVIASKKTTVYTTSFL